MDKQEQELEMLVDEFERGEPVILPSVFEIFVTTVSIFMAIMFFMFPDMLYQPGNLYHLMTVVMPQSAWALAFFSAGIIKAFGLLLGRNTLRYIGLLMSFALYVTIAVCHLINFPSIGGLVFTCMALFTVVSMPLVKYTGIKGVSRNENKLESKTK